MQSHKLLKYIYAAIVFLCSLIAKAQDKETGNFPAIQELLNKATYYSKQSQYDSASSFLNLAISQSQKNNFQKGEAMAYDQLAELMLTNGKLTEVRKYDSLILPIASKIKDTFLLINVYNRAGVYYMEKGKNKEAEQSFNIALSLGLEKQASKKTAEVNSNLGSLYLGLGEKDKAIDRFFKALRLYEKNNSEVGMGETYSNISSVYYLMGRVDDAISYQKTSIGIREKINDRPGLVITNTNIGQLYILKGSYPQALQYLQQAVQYGEQLKNPKLMAAAYSGMAAYASRTKNFAEALIWQSKAIKLFEEADNKQMLSRLYVSAGNLANATKDSLVALNFYNKALNISRELGNKENIGNAYEKLSSFYVSRNDFAKAYDNYKNYILYRDSINASSAVSKIEEIRTQYETEKKDNEISRLNTLQQLKQLQIEKQNATIAGNLSEALQKQNQIELLSKEKQLKDLRIIQQDEELEKQLLISRTNSQQLLLTEKESQLRERQLKNQKLVRNLLIAGLGLFLLLGLTYFNRYQLKKKLEQQTSLLAMRNNISQDLHDDIGASLSNINILNELARRNISQPEKSKEYLSKASEDIQRISESLSDIVWNINPRYDDLQNLFIKMKRYAADMLDGKNINGQFDFPLNEPKLTLSMTQRRDLYLIFKEAVNNLAKYSQAKNATIQVLANDHKIELLVKDDGKGFDRNNARSGNGLQNMEQRAKATGAHISVTSKPGEGTAVKLEMKIS
jgi:signal transduction histidine kinase